jgi:nitroreductase
MLYRFRKIFIRKLRPFFNKKSKENAGIYRSLNYTFFDDTFNREINAVVEGLKAYHEKGNENEVILIRNIHRIEKGLIMPNLKKEFALNYIEETTQVFNKVFENGNDKNLISYAASVLDKYFNVVSLDRPELKKLSQDFFKLKFKPVKKIPYRRKENQKNTVSYEDLKQLYLQRRSVRFFKDEPVDRNLIEKAVEGAALSPSACNRQPFKLIISDKNPLKDKLGSLPMGANTYYENVPMFIAIIGDLSNYFSERDRNLIYIDGSLFAMSFMLALETLGLSSCPINWPDIEKRERKLQETLGLKPYERCIMFLGVGYADPDKMIPFSNKKTSNQLIKYIES